MTRAVEDETPSGGIPMPLAWKEHDSLLFLLDYLGLKYSTSLEELKEIVSLGQKAKEVKFGGSPGWVQMPNDQTPHADYFLAWLKENKEFGIDSQTRGPDQWSPEERNFMKLLLD